MALHFMNFVILLAVSCVYSWPSNKPNIVVIMADDIGWNDFGFHGQNQIPTPNIDALAYSGVVLNRLYTQECGTPSRAAFFTGNYPIRSGLQGESIAPGEDRALPLDMPILPERLKELGYRNHMVGKWNLGHAIKDNTPTRRGFDTFFGNWNEHIGYFNHETGFSNLPMCKGFDR